MLHVYRIDVLGIHYSCQMFDFSVKMYVVAIRFVIFFPKWDYVELTKLSICPLNMNNRIKSICQCLLMSDIDVNCDLATLIQSCVY